MHIFHFWFIDLDLWNAFCEISPEEASCLLYRGKRKYAPLGMRLLWKYIRNYFLVYQLISRFLLYLQNYKEFEAEILHLQSEKYELSFDIKKYTTSGWALGDENVIGIRAFKTIKQALWSLWAGKSLVSRVFVLFCFCVLFCLFVCFFFQLPSNTWFCVSWWTNN